MPAREPAAFARQARQRGFTVIEVIISLSVTVIVLVGVLSLFDLASRISRGQVDIADMQQSERTAQYEIIRMLRMAGRGGLPLQSVPAIPPLPAGTQSYVIPTGAAVSVMNNVPANTFVGTKRVLANTDVLTVRGAFTNPVWAVVEGSFTVDQSAGQQKGSFRVTNTVKPSIAIPQSLKALGDAKTNNIPEALLLVSPSSDSLFHVVELDPATTSINATDGQGVPTDMTIQFKYLNGINTASYFALSGSRWNPGLTDVGYVGILEEYRYYILDEREVPGDQTTAPRPRLVRARTYPATGTVAGNPAAVYRGDATNWDVSIADNVTDLQVALGIETGAGSPYEPGDGPNKATDEWLFNDPADTPGSLAWITGKLFFVRINTTSYSARRERDYLATKTAATVVTVEDHAYTIPDMGTASATMPDRSFRRRSLRTLVDLRSLS